MKTIKEQLIELKETYPALTFNNDGYEYLSKEIKDSHKEQIEKISGLMKQLDNGFVKFFNFKDRSDGSFAIRYDSFWNKSFIGVVYLNINEINN